MHPFTYLRGIDGKLPGSKAEEKETAKTGKPAPDSETSIGHNEREMNRSEGQNQLDYIPRIADQLERLRSDVRKHGGELRAIGLVGSDFYDKLLMLQALRDRFPEVIFFTTDLDARYLQPEFLKFTRNLVITSSFGLSLHPSLQDTVPPFRNSYQTSLFFASLCALGMVDEAQVKAPAPRRFEIGRFHPVDLSVRDEEGEKSVHPSAARRLPTLREVGWLVVLVVTFCWLALRITPLLRAWLTPLGRCRLMSGATLANAEDLIDPDELRERLAIRRGGAI